ncbi:hypothetical protein [Amycolatopsis sp. NPDC051061]|uniref:hypothetical protein n=1 Tax=Amycolatopsis sp. NPDC051061 TaxID=3155042 RepID=UPI0034192C1D
MVFRDLSTDRLHEAATYFAAGEAARRTRHRIAVVPEERPFRLEINGHAVRVFSRRTAQERPMRRGTQQDVAGAHSLVFVDLFADTPAFYITPPDVAAGEVEQWRDRWDRLDAS